VGSEAHDKDVFEQFRNKKRDWRWNGMTIIHVSASTVVFLSKTRLLDLWWKDAGQRGQVVQVTHNRLLITCRQARQQPGRHWIKRIWLWRCNLVHDLALRHWFEWRQRWNGSASYDWWRYWRSCSCGLTDIADLVSEKLREVDGSLFRRRLLLRWLKHAVDGVPWLMRVAYLVVDQNAVNFCC